MSLIYHYTSLDLFAEKIFPSLKLLMNKPHLVNDPIESKFLFRLDNDNIYKKMGVSPRLHLIRQGKKYNIVCFSTDKKYRNSIVPGWGLPKMWTHYGNNHKGICIVINKERFIKQNEEIIKFKGLVKYRLKFSLPILCANKLADGCKTNYIDETINTYFNERTKFKPHRINDEMPPVFPYQAWIRNCTIRNCSVGIRADNPNGLIVENLVTRGTPKPVVVRGGRRVYFRRLDFQR